MNNEQTFEKELASVINRFSKENYSDTPDFILAQYMRDCLLAFNSAIEKRRIWWGEKPKFEENKIDV